MALLDFTFTNREISGATRRYCSARSANSRYVKLILTKSFMVLVFTDKMLNTTPGPIIDNAAPATEAIFSKDNASPNPGEDPKPSTSEQLNTPVTNTGINYTRVC